MEVFFGGVIIVYFVCYFIDWWLHREREGNKHDPND